MTTMSAGEALRQEEAVVAVLAMRRRRGPSWHEGAEFPLLRLTWTWSATFVATAVLAIVTTLVVVGVAPGAHSYGTASLHVALETWAALTALLLALLAYGRYRVTR